MQKKRQVVVATRTSQRVPRDGIPIATKATHRAMAKDNILGSSKNPFTILNDIPNATLQDVLMDLVIESDNFEEQLDIFKVEEKARAAIAEANYKCFLERQGEKNRPKDDDQLQDLAMEVISNNLRQISPTPKGEIVGVNLVSCSEELLDINID